MATLVVASLLVSVPLTAQALSGAAPVAVPMGLRGWLIDGHLQVVWEGVSAAMNVRAGGRGGAHLPEDEVDDVHEHLSRHYEEFERGTPTLE